MPITKSAKKSLKVSETKRAQNKTNKIELEKALKKVSASNINEVISKIDKAAKTGIIGKNKAARMKSSLSKKFSTVKSIEKKTAKPKSASKIRGTQSKQSEARNKS